MPLFKTNRLSKNPFIRKTVYALIFLLLVMFIGYIFLYVGIYTSKNLVVSCYTIQADVDNTIRIVQISDLHNSEFGTDNEELISAIREQNPDFIFMTGDMINRDEDDIHVVLNLVKELSDIAPIYYGYGNHEASWEKTYGDSLRDGLKDNGADVLELSYVDIDYNGLPMRIGGCMNYYRAWGMLTHNANDLQTSEDFADSFENTSRYKVLLNHIPTAWTDWGHGNDYNVNLVFSGHYHGGIIRLPILDRGLYAPYVGLFPKYTKGIISLEKAICVQNTGLGSEHFIPRVYNPPEVLVLDILSQNH